MMDDFVEQVNLTAGRMSVVLDFSDAGVLQAILLICVSAEEQKVLEKEIIHLFRPSHFCLLRRLFRGSTKA